VNHTAFLGDLRSLSCRKIRCRGGSPCHNCARSHRECDYTPVPEEVNRATREKKAIAKASKTNPSPAPSYSPFFGDTPVFDVPYVAGSQLRPGHFTHRRSVSVPNFEVAHWVPPPAPALQSPAMFESSQWMYSGWSSAPAIPIPEEVNPTRAFPSVLEETPTHDAYLHSQCGSATPSDTRSSSTESDPPYGASWSTPNIGSSYLRPPLPLTPISTRTHYRHPSSPHSSLITPSTAYHSPYPTAPFQQPHMYSASPLAHSTSPTLAPEMSKDLVGLGIGTSDENMYHTPTYLPEEQFASPLL